MILKRIFTNKYQIVAFVRLYSVFLIESSIYENFVHYYKSVNTITDKRNCEAFLYLKTSLVHCDKN